jgi:hypothetical protein
MSDLGWCQATTTAQAFGSSWASSTWSCQRRATREVDGERLCWQHARIAERSKQEAGRG